MIFYFAQLSQEAQMTATIAIVGALVTGMGTVFALLMKANLKTQENLEKLATETRADKKKCDEDREILHTKFHDLAIMVAQVKKNDA
jgi:uncharacterized membrane-anchored protein YhcB (DUF1043 family)